MSVRASTSIRKRSSTGTALTRSGMMPASRADFAIEWCICVDPYSTPARMSAPRCRSRAHTTALKCAIDPPVVNSPRVSAGNLIQSRSQSSALASSCTSAGAASRTPV